MARKKWPPPGSSIVEGDYALTETWTIHLPEQFARRIEDGDLVLWRPGVTIWLAAWGNDNGESQGKRLKKIKRDASPERFADRESKAKNLTRYSYRLREDNDGAVDAVYGFVLNDDGHLQLAVYFDEPADEVKARNLVDSVTERS